jgi:hypothetical protein
MNVRLPFEDKPLASWGIIAISLLASILGAVVLNKERKTKKKIRAG